MISPLDLPWAVRLATYSLVLGSVPIRTMTTRYNAALAWRSPPRLSRWRTTLPEDAPRGATPQSLAKAASELTRPGLSPGGDQELGCDLGSHAVDRTESGSGCRDDAAQLGIEALDLL